MWVSGLLFTVHIFLILAINFSSVLSQTKQTVEPCILTDCKPLPIHEPWCPSGQVSSISSRQTHLGVLMLCCKCMKNIPNNVNRITGQQSPRKNSRNRLKLQNKKPQGNQIEVMSVQINETNSRLRILDSIGQQNDIGNHLNRNPDFSRFKETEANRHQFPYIVSLQINGVHKCGGSIVDQLHIVTAAHCFSKRDPTTKTVTGLNLNVTGLTIVAGEHVLYNSENTEQVVQVLEIRVHPDYNFRSYQQGHDIALLTLTDCLRFKPNVIQPADFLPTDLSVDYEIRALSRSRSTMAGWGGIGLVDNRGREIASTILRTTSLNVQRCTEGYFRGIPNSVVCALGENEGGMTTDACQGDSGGPMECLIDNGRIKYVCGIVSYGEQCPVHDGTAGVYVRISYYRRWIRRVLDEDYYNNVDLDC